MKKIFIMACFFLSCFYGIWMPRGKAETVSAVKDLEMVPVSNEKKIFSHNKGKKIPPAPSVPERTVTSASKTKPLYKVNVHLWSFIIISG